MKASLPHVLLLVTDQLRFDAISPIITPNLWAFMQRNGSTTFNRAYTSTPTCTPARAALLTGKSPWAHGMLSYWKTLDCSNYPTTLPHVLRDHRGYHTVAIGKNHFGPVKHVQGYQTEKIYDGLTSYFDDYDEWFNRTMPGVDPKATCQLDWNDWPACPYAFDEYMHPTSWTTRMATEFLEGYFGEETNENPRTAPLFLKVSYHRPHSPYDPPHRLMDQYLKGGNKSHVPQLRRFVNDSSWDLKYKSVSMTRSAWAGDPGHKAARHSRAGYLASVEFVDEHIGQIFNYLESKDLWDDFMIIWVSDHGDQNGDHYLWRKGFPWEANARICMVMNLPHASNRPSQQSDALTELRDVAPTVYDVLGVLKKVKEKDPLMDGESLLPVLHGTKTAVREWIDLEHGTAYTSTNHWNALVGDLQDGRNDTECHHWKYIFHAYDASEQLFCLGNDPNETEDLAPFDGYQGILSTWRNRLVGQFEREGRGRRWLKGKRLRRRRHRSITFGKNYPCSHSLMKRATDKILTKWNDVVH